MKSNLVAVALVLAACGGVNPRYPADVQTAFVRDDMQRLETDHLVVYYPKARREQVGRFVARAEMCANELTARAVQRNQFWREKMVIAMPEIAFNNAFVAPPLAGYEDVSVVPTLFSLDFVTEFGLPPDPAYVGCHELVHYVHSKQIAGFWGALDRAFGHLFTPQVGFDSWFFEGLATHYEASLQPGVGRPQWPIFTGMFAAAVANDGFGGSDLSELGRKSHLGHNYLFGTMFVDFLARKYGDRPLWMTIGSQAKSITGLLSADAFKAGFDRSLADLIDEFRAECKLRFPKRERPSTQRSIAKLGNNARYAASRDGMQAWISSDVDVPPRLTIVATDGSKTVISLVEVLPPRKLAVSAPLLSTGLSIADNGDVYFTALDFDDITFTTRLLRVRKGASDVEIVKNGLGSGGAITPSGDRYYYMRVDGDRWSLYEYDLAKQQSAAVVEATPGQYITAVQPSHDGKRLLASVWNGARFVLWLIDAEARRMIREIDDGTAVFDGSFLQDGRFMHLGVLDGRFQVVVRNADGSAPAVASNVPYAALAPREVKGIIRLLNRDGWHWTVDEIAPPTVTAQPATSPPPAPQAAPDAASPGDLQPPGTAQPSTAVATTPSENGVSEGGAQVAPAQKQNLAVPAIASDRPFTLTDRLFVPQLHTLSLLPQGLVAGVLSGGDRLGIQRWSVTGGVQIPTKPLTKARYGGQAAYLNSLLAPWTIVASGTWVTWGQIVRETPTGQMDEVVSKNLRRQRDAQVAIGRTWRNAWSVAASAQYSYEYVRTDDPAVAFAEEEVSLGGGELSALYAAFESTPYTGPRRGVAALASVAYYPQRLSSLQSNTVDASFAVGAVLPLPIGRRHTIAGDVSLRYAPTEGGNLLELGGVYGGAKLWSRSNKPERFVESTIATPAAFRTSVPLRGYETLSFAAERILTTELMWRYPLILDRGIANLGMLPASFLRQINLAGFASYGARTAKVIGMPSQFENGQHFAVGGLLSLELLFLRIPFTVEYQLARRLRDDRALSQFVGLTLGF